MKTVTCPVILLSVFLAVVSGCGREPPYRKPLTPVRAVPVEESTEEGGVRYSASVDPYAQVDVASKVNGYVQTIHQVKGADGRIRNVQEGDVVKRGLVLAKLVTDDYVQRVNRARADLAVTQAAFERARQDFTRSSNLFATQSVTKPEYDTAKAQYDETRSRVEAARAELEEANIQLRYCELKAPMDGVILKRNIEVGSFMGPGAVAFVMADVSSVKVVFGVPDIMLGDCRMGSEIAIVTESLRGVELKGLITAVSPAADAKSRVFNIEITVPNPKDQLKIGMIAALKLAVVQPSTRAALVPLSAVVRSLTHPEGYAVFVLSEQQGKTFAQLRDIRLGDVTGSRIEVMEGVKVGEQVVAVGATLLSHGEQVRVIP